MSAVLVDGVASLVLNISTPLEADVLTPRDDLIGVKVWGSTVTPDFEPSNDNLLFDGLSLSITIPDLQTDVTYYIKYALISDIEPENYIVRGPLTGNPYIDPYSLNQLPPPTPTGVEIAVGYSTVLITTDEPTFTEGFGYANTIIFAEKITEPNQQPTFNTSTIVANFTGITYSLQLDTSSTYRIWLKWVNKAGIASQDPAGGTNGYEVETSVDISKVLTELSGNITESQFYQGLNDRINLIDDPYTGLVKKTDDLVTVFGTTTSSAYNLAQAILAVEDAEAARDSASGYNTLAESAANSAEGSASSAALSASAASESVVSANGAVSSAIAAVTLAESSATSANGYSASALAYSTAASISASEADGSAASAIEALQGVQAVIRNSLLSLDFSFWELNGQTLEKVNDGIVGSTVLKLVDGGYPIQPGYLAIDYTKTYKARFWARPVDATGLLYFSLRQYKDDQGTPGDDNGGRSPYKPSALTASTHSSLANGEVWYLYEYIWTQADWQPGVSYFRPEFLDNYGTGATGHWEVQGFSLELVQQTIGTTELVDSFTTSNWTLSNASFPSIADGVVSTTALRNTLSTTGTALHNRYLPVNSTKAFIVNFWARTTSTDTTVLLNFKFNQYKDNEGTLTTNAASSKSIPASLDPSRHSSAYGSKTTWGLYTYTWIPDYWNSDCNYVRPYFSFTSNGPSNNVGSWEIQGFSVKEVSLFDEVASAVQQKMSARSSSDGSALAEYSVVVDANGKVAGFGLSAEVSSTTGAQTSTFAVRADRFYIDNNSGSSVVPFIVENDIVYIDTARIKDASIESAKIGSLNADVINSGTINADRIAVDSISVRKIKGINTGGLTILSDDPYFQEPELWELNNTAITFVSSGAGGSAVAPSYINCNSGADSTATSVRTFPLSSDKVYRLSAMVFAASGNGRNIYLFLQFYTSDGVYVGNNITGWGGTKSGYTYGGQPETEGDWVRVGDIFGYGTARTIPSTVKYCKIGVWFQYSGNTADQVQQACQDLRLDELIDGSNLIIEGSITADRIDTRGLSIKDADGNIILAAGTSLDYTNINASADWLNSNVTLNGLGFTGDTDATKTAINYATADKWTTSNSNTSAVGRYGGNFETNGDGNKRQWLTDPFKRPAIVWTTTDNDEASNADGGWNKNITDLDPNKSYMSFVFVRRTSNTTSGTFYHGCSQDYTLNLNGSANGNPYFWSGGIGNLEKDEWYLSVGIIHANNSGTTVSTEASGLYKLATGAKTQTYTDYKMSTTGQQTHRTYLYYSTNPDASLQWWGPGFYEINGNEPSISQLLSLGSIGAISPSNPITNNNIGTYIANAAIEIAQIKTASIQNLSSLSADIGTVTAGVLKSSDDKFVIDLTNKTIKIEV